MLDLTTVNVPSMRNCVSTGSKQTDPATLSATPVPITVPPPIPVPPPILTVPPPSSALAAPLPPMNVPPPSASVTLPLPILSVPPPYLGPPLLRTDVPPPPLNTNLVPGYYSVPTYVPPLDQPPPGYCPQNLISQSSKPFLNPQTSDAYKGYHDALKLPNYSRTDAFSKKMSEKASSDYYGNEKAQSSIKESHSGKKSYLEGSKASIGHYTNLKTSDTFSQDQKTYRYSSKEIDDYRRRDYKSSPYSGRHKHERSPSINSSSSRYRSDRSPSRYSPSSHCGSEHSSRNSSHRHSDRLRSSSRLSSATNQSSQSRDSSRSPTHHLPSYRHSEFSRSSSRYSSRDYQDDRPHSSREYRDASHYSSRDTRKSPLSQRQRSPSRSSCLRRSPNRHSSLSYEKSRPRDIPSRKRSRSRDSRDSSVKDSDISKKIGQLLRETKGSDVDREKILKEYGRNYCSTPEDIKKKIDELSQEKQEEEAVWYRSSPADLYYEQQPNGIVEQKSKLVALCEEVFKQLIERGRKVRPEVDELPPIQMRKPKLCTHNSDKSSSSDSDCSLEVDEGLNELMQELTRKQSHPRRLHPEMWFNNSGEMNGGPVCRCSARARRQGIRHGIYAGEHVFPKCRPNSNNLDRLHHYRITVSPPTNFLIRTPTIIGHDEHEFLFSGFSMFSHYPLPELPMCKVIRFNIEYTILYVKEDAPTNFTIQELDLFEEYLFTELLELVDLDLGKATHTTCSQFHFMPRFVRTLPDGGCEVLSMCEVLKYLVEESGLLVEPGMLEAVHHMDHYTWQKFVDRIKGMIVTYPGKKPCSLRVDQLDRTLPEHMTRRRRPTRDEINSFYPEIVHFGIRPPQLSYAGNPEYQKAWRYYVKCRHLIANMAKPTSADRQKLQAKEARLQEMRMQSRMKRDVTVAISSEGFHTTGLMCDVVQHAMLIPVLVRHLRFHKSLESLEKKIKYKFKNRALLQTALTHPSYRENFGTNPDHARNSLTNCGIRQPEYGDRRIHYLNTRKKGINILINIMSRFGKNDETESAIKHNERLEFLGDAVVEFLSTIHLFLMFPGLAEGGLATYRAAIVQNQHLALLAKKIGLEQYMLHAHGSDLCQDVVMRHAMANCFEALMGALFLDGTIRSADAVFALALWWEEPVLLATWRKPRGHPLQEQEPLGDRKYIKSFDFLAKLTHFEDSIGVKFKHIRLLARAFTDRSVGYTHLTMGSNQRLEFLGDTVLQLVVSDKLYRHFPEHHEGHLSLLRSSLVNNRTQSEVCDDLNLSEYAVYASPKAKPTTKKHKADLLEAFLGALFIDKSMEYCVTFCDVCLFPRLQQCIVNQEWNDPKSKLQQCCLTLRSMEGGEPDIPQYKVIECLGPTNTRVYTVAVYFRGMRLASARGHSIQDAEMNAAEAALNSANELFPQLDQNKRVVSKTMKRKRKAKGSDTEEADRAREKDLEFPSNFRESFRRKKLAHRVPKAYATATQADSNSDSSLDLSSDENSARGDKGSSGSDQSEGESELEDTRKLEGVKVTSLLSDMERLKDELIRTGQYSKLKEKVNKSDSDSS